MRTNKQILDLMIKNNSDSVYIPEFNEWVSMDDMIARVQGGKFEIPPRRENESI